MATISSTFAEAVAAEARLHAERVVAVDDDALAAGNLARGAPRPCLCPRVSVPSNQTSRWVMSQNGQVPDSPQRHSSYVRPSASPHPCARSAVRRAPRPPGPYGQTRPGRGRCTARQPPTSIHASFTPGTSVIESSPLIRRRADGWRRPPVITQARRSPPAASSCVRSSLPPIRSSIRPRRCPAQP